MRQKLKIGLLAAVLILFAGSVFATTRTKINIGADWKFQKTTASTPSSPTYYDANWATVSIPHTWNATDAQDGGGNYSRTVGWYRKKVNWDPAFEGKRIYLEVLAASLQADTYVNGTHVGQHKGGYNAFRYDITNQMNSSGETVIAVKVDNRSISDIAPLSGDFSFIGGMYRNVYLIVADEVAVDLDDDATNGLYLTTTNVSKTSAKLEVKANVVNKSAVSKTVNLKATLKNPDSFDAIAEIPNPRFNPATLSPGGVVQTVEESAITIPAGGSYEFKKEITVSNPRLWDGMEDPYRYLVDFEVSEGATLLDEVSDYVGFRFFHADNTGFYLNGRLYPLRGVNRHQDWEDMGYAISEKEHDIDFGMMYEIGANTVRLAHYPQDPYFHELFDKYGVVVWVEIPFVDKFDNDTAKFMTTTRMQLREMVKQRYNRASILMWGLQNEVSTGSYDAQMSKIVPQLHNYTKQLDPTGRLTVQAQAGTDRSGWTTDLFGKNQYPGWYQSGTFGSYMDGYKNKHYVNGKYHPVGMSEYGAGGNPNQHEIITKSGTTPPGAPYGHQQPWHPEEYQSLIHELAIKDINARPWIWGTYVWNMFDFASDSRNEGETPGINDKGIVTHDRQIKKDAFYVYKVNWNDEPEVYIASRRYVNRETAKTPVKVYTNRASVELFVNGVSQGVRNRTAGNAGILEWTNVDLSNKGVGEAGKNIIEAKSADGYNDVVEWFRAPSASTNLSSTKLVIDNSQRVISLTVNVSVAQINTYITSESNATFVLTESDGETVVTSGNVLPGMKLLVTAEDGITKAVYEFIMQHIAYKRPVTVSATENATNKAENAVDGDIETRWAAPNNASTASPHWIEVDLGKDFVLNNIGIHWFDNPTNTRAYKYSVLSKKDKATSYETVVNRLNNTENLFVSDAIQNKTGRYVKVNVVGSTNSSAYAYPSIFELQINGWMIRSEKYEIDFEKMTITVPTDGSNIDSDQFLANIQFEGNETHRIESAAYYIVDGAQLVIVDSSGKETAFTLKLNMVSSIKQGKGENVLFTVSNKGNELKIKLNDGGDAALIITDTLGKQLINTHFKNETVVALPHNLYIIQLVAGTQNPVSIKYLMN